MRSTLTLILDPLIGLYALCFAMRLAMQWVRADFRNPIVQFVLTVTNPLVLPVRRFVPPIHKIDTATLLVYIVIGWAAMTVLTALECFIKPGLFTTLLLGCVYCMRLLLSAYTFIIIGYVILSWIGQGNYNPSVQMISHLLGELALPVMRPVQKIIPPIAGLDLSPIFLLIGLQVVSQILMTPAFSLVVGKNCLLAGIL